LQVGEVKALMNPSHHLKTEPLVLYLTSICFIVGPSIELNA